MASERLLFVDADADSDSEQTIVPLQPLASGTPDRSAYTTRDTVQHIWTRLGLPAAACENIALPQEDQLALPSSFKIGQLAQASICLSALAARLVDAQINGEPAESRKVTVPLRHAAIEFGSEQHYRLNDQIPKSSWGPIGGLHKTADGYVRVHDNFPNHRIAAYKILRLDPLTATREDVAEKMLPRRCYNGMQSN